MRLDYANYEIIDALLKSARTPRIAPLNTLPGKAKDEDKELYIVSVSGTVAYVLEYDEICFNIGRCRQDPDGFSYVMKDENICRIDNLLEPTMDIRVAAPDPKRTLADFILGDNASSRLLTRFKGATWDTFVNIDLLEAFDNAKFYQSNPTGPIAVVEEGCLVGFVAPVKVDNLNDHYSDSPAKREEE